MKVLSFDVGIKNLAYCLINKNEDNFNIEDWGIINLDDDRKKCTIINKKNNKCSKTATYYNDTNYYCNKCKKKYVLPTFNTTEVKENFKCSYSNTLCNKKAKIIINGIEGYYCLVHYKSIINNIIKKNKPKKLIDRNCNKIPMQILATKLYTNLNIKLNFLTANEILIENQPTFLNPTMKTISALLYGYFCIKGITDKHITKSNIEVVKFYSPSNKLKVNKTHTDNLLDGEIDNNKKIKKNNNKKIYEITKDLGKAYCLALVKDTDKYNFLNSQTKKDDLCDSFLQAFFYLFCNNQTIPDKYKILLDKITEEVKTVEQLKKKISNKK